MSYYFNKTIEYGLYLLVFLLPVQTRWLIKPEASEYLTISLYGTDVLLIGLLILFIVSLFLKQRITNQELRIKNYESRITNLKTLILNSKFLILISIAGLGLTAFVSIFFTPDKLIAVQSCLRLLLGIGLFWLITNANYNRIKLIYYFLAGIFFQACLGIWQFLTQSSFSNKWLGMASHNASDLGVSVVETLRAGRWLRAYGGLDHPNVLGGALAVGILLMINLMIKNRKSGILYSKFSIFNFQFSNNFQFSIFKQYLFFIFYFLFLVFITALFFTFSRGAWAGLIIGVLAILAMMIIKKDLQGQKALLKIIFPASVLIFILFSQYQDLVLTRLSQDTRLEVKSNVERVESLRESWEVIKDNWLGGVGVGNYARYDANPRINANVANCEYTNNVNDINCKYIQPVHNVFLLVWAELGIFGLLFFVSLLLCVMRYALCEKDGLKENNLGFKLALSAALIAMFLVDHWWWSLHFGVLLFWLVLGLIIAVDSGNDKIYNENII